MSSLSLGQRIGALFRWRYLEVMVANGWAAIGIGAIVRFTRVAPDFVLPTVVGVFVLLTGMLLNRTTFWISATVGSLVIAASCAFLGMALGRGLHALWGLLAGAVLGFNVGFFVSFDSYQKASSIARGMDARD